MYAISESRSLKMPAFKYLAEYFLKKIFVNELALSRLGYWWLVYNNYNLAHFYLLSDFYWLELLPYLEKKDSVLASQELQYFES